MADILSEDQFATAVRHFCQEYRGSVTSWGRTVFRSKLVGGFASDPHTWWLGADVVWDTPYELDVIVAAARLYGLWLIRETKSPHDHLQPLGWVNKEHLIAA